MTTERSFKLKENHQLNPEKAPVSGEGTAFVASDLVVDVAAEREYRALKAFSEYETGFAEADTKNESDNIIC